MKALRRSKSRTRCGYCSSSNGSRSCRVATRFLRTAFDTRSLVCFAALTNIQELKMGGLDLSSLTHKHIFTSGTSRRHCDLSTLKGRMVRITNPCTSLDCSQTSKISNPSITLRTTRPDTHSITEAFAARSVDTEIGWCEGFFERPIRIIRQFAMPSH